MNIYYWNSRYYYFKIRKTFFRFASGELLFRLRIYKILAIYRVHVRISVP